MRSRAETFLSILSALALIVLMLSGLRPATRPAFRETGNAALRPVLAEWTAQPPADSLGVTFSLPPGAAERDWLAALRSSGTGVRWSGVLSHAALETEREAMPGGGMVARVAAAPSARVRISDPLGILDSGTGSEATTQEFRLPGTASSIVADIGGAMLRRTPETIELRPVVVLGEADWESRFITGALEADRWQVDSRLRVAPERWVTQGRPLPLDTARHAAVIVVGRLDAAAVRSVRAFVRSGGGLVLGGGTFGLDDLAPGRAGNVVRSVAALGLPASRAQLEYRTIGRLAPDAGALASSSPGARMAARRVGAGRVLQLGDQDTWRLAMASDAGRREHALLWSRAVSFVSPRHPARPEASDDVAPLAALVSRLGPPSPPSARSSLPEIPWVTLAGALLFATLVAEWASRRLRGER